MSKKQSTLKQMLEKYHTQIEQKSNDKNTFNKPALKKIITVSNSQENNSNINNHSNFSNHKIVNFEEKNDNKEHKNTQIEIKDIRNKNLEEMLKKLNSKQATIETLSHNQSFKNNPINNSGFINMNNKSFQSSAQLNNNYINDKSFYFNKNKTKDKHDLNDNEESKNILSILKKSKKNTEINERNKKLFHQAADTLLVSPYNQFISIGTNNASITNTIITQNTNNSITNSNQPYTQNQILKTSKETSYVVKTIDEKVKELKMKFLRDQHINYDKLAKYSSTLGKLYIFSTSLEMNGLFNSCRKAKINIIQYLKEKVNKYIISTFIDNYANQFQLENAKLIFISKQAKKDLNVVLVIKSKVNLPSKFANCTIEIENSSSLINKNNGLKKDKNQKYINLYRFDYQHNTSSSQIWWVLKEKTFFNYDDNANKAYCMPIVPFKSSDFFEISISILSNFGMIDFESFQWKNLKYKKITNSDYINYNNGVIKKKKERQLSDFDLSRFCEMELIKTKWTDYSKFQIKPLRNEIKQIKNALIELFEVDKIEFEDVGFYIFKIYITAIQVGKMDESSIGIEIRIKDKKDNCCNEVRKNGLICERGKGFEIRVGDIVVLYLTRNKNEESNSYDPFEF